MATACLMHTVANLVSRPQGGIATLVECRGCRNRQAPLLR